MIKTKPEVGAKIRCVDTGGYRFLTKGKIYEVCVSKFQDYSYTLNYKDDNGDVMMHFYENGKIEFELVEEQEEVKEDKQMNKESLFKVGDVVWCMLHGKGNILSISPGNYFPVQVKFDSNTEWYTMDGKYAEDYPRTLFFSEPKIEALTERPFVPTLVGKRIAVKEHGCECYVVDVVDETVERIKFWVVTNSIKPYEVDKSKIEAIYEVSSENLLTKNKEQS